MGPVQWLAVDPGPEQSGYVVKRTGCGKPGVSVLPAATEEERVRRRKETMRRASAKYNATNRERLNERQRQRRKANLPEQARRLREYRARNPEKMKAIESRRVRPPEQRAKFNRYRRQWVRENPDKLREHAHKRAGKKVGKLSRGSIKAIGCRQEWLCAICTVDLVVTGYHMDHIVALANDGPHTPENIQLLCPPCNLGKGTKDLAKFKRERAVQQC